MLDLDYIRLRCVEDGDCWLWQGALNSTGHPIMKYPGRPCSTVRRLVMEAAGDPPAPRQPTVNTCGDPLCVSPAHTAKSTIQKVGKEAAKRGAFSRLDRRMKIAATRRKTAKLTIEKANEIRHSSEGIKELAERYSVNPSFIKAIRRGDVWRDYSNPITQLIR